LCHLHHAAPRMRPWYAHVFVATAIAVTMTRLYLGDEAFDNKPWQLLIPMLAFLLTGSRAGLRWTGVGVAGITLVLVARWTAYEPVAILIFLVVYATLAYSLLVFTQWNEANLRAIERLSYTDSLTQVYNRQLFDELCADLLARVHASGETLALYMIDIDHFKAFNDRYGHLAGDRALCGVAGALRGAARRASDLVFRYGGEEFCVVAAGMSASDAFDMARAMRDGVRELEIENSAGEDGRLTVSVGLTFVTEPGPHSLAVLLQAADEALYAAKQGGRNRVEIAARPRLVTAGA